MLSSLISPWRASQSFISYTSEYEPGKHKAILFKFFASRGPIFIRRTCCTHDECSNQIIPSFQAHIYMYSMCVERWYKPHVLYLFIFWINSPWYQVIESKWLFVLMLAWTEEHNACAAKYSCMHTVLLHCICSEDNMNNLKHFCWCPYCILCLYMHIIICIYTQDVALCWGSCRLSSMYHVKIDIALKDLY